jgi:hypothetical protein
MRWIDIASWIWSQTQTGLIPVRCTKFCGKESKRSMGKQGTTEVWARYRTCHKFIIPE